MIKRALLFSLAIGVIMYGVMCISNQYTITLINSVNVNGENFLTLDTWGYIQYIKDTWSAPNGMFLQVPTRAWSSIDIINNLAVIVDYLILLVNILLFPLRGTAYIMKGLISLLGINVDHSQSALKWLGDIINVFRTLSIPYI